MKTENKAILTVGNIPKQLISLAIPMIAGMLSMVIFNLTDTFFVARLGENELAALTFTFPVVMSITSISAGIGIGAGSLIARYLGEGNHYKVQRLTTDSLTLGFILISAMAIVGIFTIEPLFTLLGAEGEIIGFIKDYMFIWYFGVSMVVIPMIGNNIIRALGDTKTPGLTMTISATLNIILDPLLIFGVGFFPKMGVKGAALTTVVSRGLSAIIALYILHYRRRLITFKRITFKEIMSSWKEVLHIGIPSATLRLALPVGSGFITRLLSAQGPLVVAGFGVATRIEFFAMAPINALASIMGPFTGQNLGAGKLDRVNQGKKVAQLLSVGAGVIIAILLAIFARPLARVFNDNPLIVDTTALYLRIVPLAYGLSGILQISSTILNVYKKPFHASGLMALQVFGLYIPFALAGAHFYGQVGVFSSLFLSYILAGLISTVIVDQQIRKYSPLVRS